MIRVSLKLCKAYNKFLLLKLITAVLKRQCLLCVTANSPGEGRKEQTELDFSYQ